MNAYDNSRWIECADVAVLVRSALAQSFPGVKFSVKSSTYSGGASINVSWTEGPQRQAVEQIAKRFEGSTFDGMVDLKSHHVSTLNGETVRYGADFVFCQRLTRTEAEEIARYQAARKARAAAKKARRQAVYA